MSRLSKRLIYAAKALRLDVTPQPFLCYCLETLWAYAIFTSLDALDDFPGLLSAIFDADE
jgi:hypothetical protein